MIKDKIKISGGQGCLIALGLLVVFLVTFAVGDAGRAKAACIAVSVIGLSAFQYRKRWPKLSFRIAIALLVIFHILLIAAIPWRMEGPGPVLAGYGLLDLLVCFGAVALADKISKKSVP